MNIVVKQKLKKKRIVEQKREIIFYVYICIVK